jgi:hypothetical protein
MHAPSAAAAGAALVGVSPGVAPACNERVPHAHRDTCGVGKKQCAVSQMHPPTDAPNQQGARGRF